MIIIVEYHYAVLILIKTFLRQSKYAKPGGIIWMYPIQEARQLDQSWVWLVELRLIKWPSEYQSCKMSINMLMSRSYIAAFAFQFFFPWFLLSALLFFFCIFLFFYIWYILIREHDCLYEVSRIVIITICDDKEKTNVIVQDDWDVYFNLNRLVFDKANDTGTERRQDKVQLFFRFSSSSLCSAVLLFHIGKY